MELKYLLMEDRKPGLVHKQNAVKREGLEPKVNVFKICVKLWRCGEESNVIRTCHRQSPSGRRLWAIF